MFETDEALYVLLRLFKNFVHAGIDAEQCFEDRANRGSTSIIYLFV